MFATIVDRHGNCIFVGFCSLPKGALLDSESAEMARLMGEIDKLMMGVIQRRESLERAGNLDPAAIKLAAASQLKQLWRNSGA